MNYMCDGTLNLRENRGKTLKVWLIVSTSFAGKGFCGAGTKIRRGKKEMSLRC